MKTETKINARAIVSSSVFSLTSGVLPVSANEILNAHNSYRSEVGVPPLTWSDDLARQAKEYANYLTSTGKFEHSSVKNQGENLWRGTSFSKSFTEIVGRWGEEKKYFVNKPFPNVSRTGKWQDVGHYTQIIWRNTTEVGCAGTDGSNRKYTFVCRYHSPGNVKGQSAF